MQTPIRFHLAESMPNAVAEGLRRRGIDVTTSSEAQLLAAKDEEQLAFATRETRVLVTRDQDFLRLNASGIKHAGIVYWTERQLNLDCHFPESIRIVAGMQLQIATVHF